MLLYFHAVFWLPLFFCSSNSSHSPTRTPGSRPHEALHSHPRITQHLISPFPAWFPRRGVFFPLFAACKIVFQIVQLMWCLLVATARPDYILVQVCISKWIRLLCFENHGLVIAIHINITFASVFGSTSRLSRIHPRFPLCSSYASRAGCAAHGWSSTGTTLATRFSASGMLRTDESIAAFAISCIATIIHEYKIRFANISVQEC